MFVSAMTSTRINVTANTPHMLISDYHYCHDNYNLAPYAVSAMCMSQ